MAKNISLGTISIDEQVKNNVLSVLKTGRLSYGPFTQKFEQKFAKLHQCQEAVFCNSGTSALLVAIQALKIKYHWSEQSEIIAPALTFVASINTILQNQLQVKLVDVDPITFNLDPNKLEAAITKHTKAILVAHLFGQPANVSKIKKIAQKHHLKIIEDSCETMFATHKNKPVGSFGDVACFSTYAAHLITTGVGGLVTSNNLALMKIIRSLINHGRDEKYLSIDDDNQLNDQQLKAIIKKRFLFKYLGHSFRLGELEAAIGLAQLAHYQKIIQPRQKNAAYLTQHLAKLQAYLQLPTIESNNTHDFMVYPLVLKTKKIKLIDLLVHLEKQHIETRYLLPLINQPIYHHYQFSAQQFPVAKFLEKNGFYLGCHQDLSKKDLDKIVSTLTDFFHHHDN